MQGAILAGLGLVALAFTIQPASAADLSAPAYRAPPAAAPFNWTGFYVGGHVGWGWADTTIRDVDCYPFSLGCSQPTLDYDADGIIGGVQAGYNWQAGNLVFGVELDFSGSAMNERLPTPFVSPAFLGESFSTDIDWFGTGRVRLGYAADRALFYLTGGFAYADVDNRYNDPIATNFAVSSKVKWGWTVGGGVEYAFAPQWTVRAEYLYVDLEDSRATLIDGLGVPFRFEWENDFHIARAGLNYKW